MTYKWIAHHSDGSFIEQIEGTDQYSKINREILSAFSLLKDDKLHYRLFLEEGQRLIYRHVASKSVSLTGKGETYVPGYYMIGYQEKVNGKNRQCITYVDEVTGLIQTAGKFVAGSQPKFREDELIG
jgi:hypothetical protein